MLNFLITTAYAQAENMAEVSPIQRIVSLIPMFIMVFLIFYILVHLPQQKEQKKREELINNLKKGDTVNTTSGIIGKVSGINTDSVLIEIASGVRVKFDKNAIKTHVPTQSKSQAKK